MFLLEKRRERGLLNKTLRCAAPEINDAGDTGVSHHIHHVENILDDVEHEIVLLLKTSTRNTDCQTAISNCRAEDWDSRFVS